MKTILEYFLDALEINYTKHFTKVLYQEHPHKYNMYGLKQMLDVYCVKALGVCSDTKDLYSLNYPCILHIMVICYRIGLCFRYNNLFAAW